MKKTVLTLALVCISFATFAQHREYAEIPKDIPTKEKIKSKIGTLLMPNGYPTKETVAKLEDEMMYVNGVQTYVNTMQGISLWAMRKGFIEAGIKDNDFVVFPEMMDGNQLFLTANMDTYYYMSFIDLSNGPMVFESPVNALGVIDDMWFNWVTDFGIPGSDRGEGGKYLLVPDWYEGTLPDGGYYIRRCKTDHVWVAGRSFLVDNSPAKPIKDAEVLAVYPYSPGGQGTSVGDYLAGNAKLGPLSKYKNAKLIDGTGMTINTLPPSNYQHFVMLNDMIQAEPATGMDSDIGGLALAIGIEKGKPFNPDAKTIAILNEAVNVGNAYVRAGAVGALERFDFDYYGNSGWWNPLWVGGYTFTTPPAEIKSNGDVVQSEYKGALHLAARTSFLYAATGITPAMCMNLTGMGSQYLFNHVDKDGVPLDGGKTYKLILPKDIPVENFWSMTVYDMQTRSIIQTDQRSPRVGSQSFPTPAAEENSDGSVTVYYGPTKPAGVPASNWIQTNPDRGWFQLLRCYSPSKAFFDKSWRIGEVELVK